MKKEINTLIRIDFVGSSDVSTALPLPPVFTRICRMLVTTDVQEAFNYALSLVDMHKEHYAQICPTFEALITVSKRSPITHKFRHAIDNYSYRCTGSSSK